MGTKACSRSHDDAGLFHQFHTECHAVGAATRDLRPDKHGAFSHLETYEPGEEEELPSGMNVWKIPQSKKALKSDLDRMTERFNVAMEHLSEGEQRAVRKELGEETNEDREQARLDSFITRMMDEKEHTTGDFGWLEPNGTFHEVEWGEHQDWANKYVEENYPDQSEDIFDAGGWLTDREPVAVQACRTAS